VESNLDPREFGFPSLSPLISFVEDGWSEPRLDEGGVETEQGWAYIAPKSNWVESRFGDEGWKMLVLLAMIQHGTDA